MFTRILQILIWVGFVISIIGLLGLAASTPFGGAAIFFVGIPIIVMVFCVIGTFMEMAVSIKNIEKQLKNMSSINRENFNNTYVAPTPAPVVSKQVNSKICPHCHTEVSPDVKFCQQCGKEVG